MITALTAIGALIFTGLSLNATRDQVAVSQQGQFTDRYSRAIEQLGQQGPDRLQVRLGGIYALERLARDSPRDQPTIIEVLAAFVRTNARKPPNPVGSLSVCPTSESSLQMDVQAALTVLGRRAPENDGGAVIDLSRSCLSWASMENAELAGAIFWGTGLYGADFSDAILDDVQFSGIMTGVDMTGAVLTDVFFNGVDLRGARLRGANVDGANFSYCAVQGADLRVASHNNTDMTCRTDEYTLGDWWYER